MIEMVQRCEFHYHASVLAKLGQGLMWVLLDHLSGEFVKGDMYIRDLRHTSGHISSISSLSWHPTNPSLFLTASSDSTLRIWDKTNRRSSKSVIVVKSKERGGKTKVTSCCWSKPDGKLIAAASEDGSLMIWKASGNFTRPDYVRLSFCDSDGSHY